MNLSLIISFILIASVTVIVLPLISIVVVLLEILIAFLISTFLPIKSWIESRAALVSLLNSSLVKKLFTFPSSALYKPTGLKFDILESIFLSIKYHNLWNQY